jgi:hypothetical protein
MHKRPPPHTMEVPNPVLSTDQRTNTTPRVSPFKQDQHERRLERTSHEKGQIGMPWQSAIHPTGLTERDALGEPILSYCSYLRAPISHQPEQVLPNLKWHK